MQPTASCIQRLEIAKFQELPYKNVTLWEKADRLLLLLVLTHPGEIVRNHDTLSVIKLCLLAIRRISLVVERQLFTILLSGSVILAHYFSESELSMACGAGITVIVRRYPTTYLGVKVFRLLLKPVWSTFTCYQTFY